MPSGNARVIHNLLHAKRTMLACLAFALIRPAQRAQLDRLKADQKLADTSVAQFLGPEFGVSKINRLRIMAQDKNPKIRESVALSYHVPEEVMRALAKDKNEGVRICVARNESTPCDILRIMASDKSAQVRSWVAVNFFVPADVMEVLAQDDSAEVRKLVAWKTSLSESSDFVSSK